MRKKEVNFIFLYYTVWKITGRLHQNTRRSTALYLKFSRISRARLFNFMRVFTLPLHCCVLCSYTLVYHNCATLSQRDSCTRLVLCIVPCGLVFGSYRVVNGSFTPTKQNAIFLSNNISEGRLNKGEFKDYQQTPTAHKT